MKRSLRIILATYIITVILSAFAIYDATHRPAKPPNCHENYYGSCME